MAKNFVFKETLIRSMKIAGLLDTDNMLIDIDGETRSLSTLLSPFNGADIDFVIKLKDERDLDEPVEYFDPDDPEDE